MVDIINKIETDDFTFLRLLRRKIETDVQDRLLSLSTTPHFVAQHLIRRTKSADADWRKENILVDEQARTNLNRKRPRHEDRADVADKSRKNSHQRDDRAVKITVEPRGHGEPAVLEPTADVLIGLIDDGYCHGSHIPIEEHLSCYCWPGRYRCPASVCPQKVRRTATARRHIALRSSPEQDASIL